VTARVLVLDAGSAGANNLIRSLRAGDPSIVIVGCNENRYVLKKSGADSNYVLDAAVSRVAALRRIVRTERIDLAIPTSDAGIQELSELRATLGCRTFLPRKSMIVRCRDKYTLTLFLRRRGIPAPLTYPIRSRDEVDRVFRRLRPRSRLWCRIREGSGSYGAIPVTNPDQARSWIAYWEEMRGVAPGSFTLSEYLPGRDFCVQCLWDRGTLVLAKMAERLVYLDNGSPSGVSSMPALACTAFNARALDAARRAIRALDARASGVFFVDIKESSRGEPCITEINAGRFATMTNIHDLTGEYNMAATFVRLALGERIRIRGARDYAEGYYLVRSVDTVPAVFGEDELFEGVRDADPGATAQAVVAEILGSYLGRRTQGKPRAA
jgi:carbamoyl-phosphate synthase large subunit